MLKHVEDEDQLAGILAHGEQIIQPLLITDY
jgi:hypothetical protein